VLSKLKSFASWWVLAAFCGIVFYTAWQASRVEARPDAHLPIVGKATGLDVRQMLLKLGEPLDVLDD
jgi:hypothetical protein